MSFQENLEILATKDERMEYLKGIVLASQMHEKPLELSDLQAKLDGLEGEAWSRELLRSLHASEYKASWKKFKEDKDIKDIPKPFIGRLENKLYIFAKNNEEEILVLDVGEEKLTIMPIQEANAKWDRVALLLRPKLSLKELPKHFGLAWFLPVFWKFRRYFYEVLAASCLLQIFALISPLFTQVIIDKVLVHKGLSTLDVLGAGLVFLAFFNMVLGYLRTYIFTTLTNKVDVTLGAKLFAHITGLPIRYFENHRVGETIARVKELENIRSFISGSSLVLVLDTAFCFIFIIAMFWYNKLLCLVALAIIPFMVLLNVIATPIFRKRIEEKFEAGAENQSFLVEAVTGAETVKSLALEQRFVRRWEDLLGHYVKTSFNVNNTANAANSIGGFLQQLSTLLILWVGARLVIAGELSVGQLIAFQMLSGQVSGPILRLVGVWQEFQQVRISIERIGDILNTKSENEDAGEKTEIKEGRITFDKVSFRYGVDEPQVLKNISLEMDPGVMVGIVGPSGSGKSTFAKLLQKLYDPEEGRILVDGVDISKYAPSAYRRQIGSVLQDNYLFHGTIRDNIAISKPGASKEEIENVARMSGAYDFIMKMKKGFDTLVGERGDSLSGGQRQKLAISRALLVNPRILIFDEATSALDALSEKEVLNQIEKIRHGRTVLMIAHRLAAVRRANMILVMFQGNIVEHGTHEQLLSKNGLYARMYHEQEGV